MIEPEATKPTIAGITGSGITGSDIDWESAWVDFSAALAAMPSAFDFGELFEQIAAFYKDGDEA